MHIICIGNLRNENPSMSSWNIYCHNVYISKVGVTFIRQLWFSGMMYRDGKTYVYLFDIVRVSSHFLA